MGLRLRGESQLAPDPGQSSSPAADRTACSSMQPSPLAPPRRTGGRRRPRSALPARARSRTCSHQPSAPAVRGSAASRRDRSRWGSRGLDGPGRGRGGPCAAVAGRARSRMSARRSSSQPGSPLQGGLGVSGSGVLGFPSRARVGCRGLCRCFRSPEDRKVSCRDPLCGRNPGPELTVGNKRAETPAGGRKSPKLGKPSTRRPQPRSGGESVHCRARRRPRA
jgi:hypothetical protein